MTAPGLAGLEPRNVVLASVGDARLSEASSELETLHERMLVLAAEVEAGERRAHSAPSPVALSESAQLTLQFVDDLVSTNRQRMRDQVSQRYAWAGERLTGAHADAQAMVAEALAELTAAMRDHDAAREHHLDDLPLAALMASVAPVDLVDLAPVDHVAPVPPVPPEVETASAVVAEHAGDTNGAVADGLQAEGLDDGPEDPGPQHQETAADDASVPDLPVADPDAAVARLAAEVGASVPLDGVVDSAVQAILRALTEPAAEAPPVPLPLRSAATVSPRVTTPVAPLEAPTDGEPETLAAAPPTITEEPLAPPVGDDAELAPIEVERPSADGPAQGYGDFWGDKVHATESRQSRLRPRDVMIAMLVLVAFVLVALTLIG